MAETDAKDETTAPAAEPKASGKKSTGKAAPKSASRSGGKSTAKGGKGSAKKAGARTQGVAPEAAPPPPSADLAPPPIHVALSGDGGQVISGPGGPGVRAVDLPGGGTGIGVAAGENMPTTLLRPVRPPGTPPLTAEAPLGQVQEPPGATTTAPVRGRGKKQTPATGAATAPAGQALMYCNHPNHAGFDFRHDNRFFTVPVDDAVAPAHLAPGMPNPNYKGAPVCPVCNGQGDAYLVADKTVPANVAQAHRHDR